MKTAGVKQNNQHGFLMESIISGGGGAKGIRV